MSAFIYGIEQSTDSRAPRTKVIRSRSAQGMREWADGGGGFTYPDPEGARNFHHSFRSLWEMPKGWRKPSRAALSKMAREKSSRDYPRNETDALADIIALEGTEVTPTPSPRGGGR